MKISSSIAWGTRPSMIWVLRTPWSSALVHAFTFGIIPPEMALDFGLTGPMLRASGVDFDLRRDLPYSLYGEIWNDGVFQIPIGTGEMGALGDCWDRAWCRVMEMIESIK